MTVAAGYEGQRIDNFLITHLKGVPKSRIYRLLRTGQIRVNKGRVKAGFRVSDGDTIRIPPLRLPDSAGDNAAVPSSLISELMARQLYVDDELIIVNKPAGIAAHGGSGIRFGIIEIMRACYPDDRELDLVHRLDRDTSGCLLLARKRTALKQLHDMFQHGSIQKQYLALLAGNWRNGRHIIDTPLAKTRNVSGQRLVQTSDEGRASRSCFIVEHNYAGCCLARVILETGRMHQIRVHAASAEHAVAGDTKYGEREFNRHMKSYGLKRLFLHAANLTFVHPLHGRTLSIDAPLDSDLAAVLEKIERQPR